MTRWLLDAGEWSPLCLPLSLVTWSGGIKVRCLEVGQTGCLSYNEYYLSEIELVLLSHFDIIAIDVVDDLHHALDKPFFRNSCKGHLVEAAVCGVPIVQLQ